MGTSSYAAGRLRRSALAALPCLLLGALWTLSAQAASVDGFGMQDYPRLNSDSVLVAYDWDTNTLNAASFVVTLDLGDEGGTINSIAGTGFRINGGSFSQHASDSHGPVFDFGTIEIFGTDPELGLTSGVLLSGTWIDVAFLGEGAGSEILVLFEVTGGDLADMFGSRGVVALTNTGYQGDFSADWANDGSGFATTAPSAIPLPAGIWLLGAALFGLVPAARRR